MHANDAEKSTLKPAQTTKSIKQFNEESLAKSKSLKDGALDRCNAMLKTPNQ